MIPRLSSLLTGRGIIMILRLIGHDISPPPSQMNIDSVSVAAFSPTTTTTTSNILSRGLTIQSVPFKPLTYMPQNDSLETDQDDQDLIPQASLKNLKKTINEIENSIEMGEEIMKETNSYLQKVEDILGTRKTTSYLQNVEKMITDKYNPDKLETDAVSLQEEESILGNDQSTPKEEQLIETDIVSDDDNDIIRINLGYKTIVTTRSTLYLAEGSKFSTMFSGRCDNDLTLDEEGRVVIDEDPELIELIINFLRQKKREDPEGRRIRFTGRIPDDKKEDFDSLLDYYGLTSFFFGKKSYDVSEAEVIQPYNKDVKVTKTGKKIQLRKKDNCFSTDNFVYLRPSLDVSGDGAFWKVTVLHKRFFVYIGIIKNLDPPDASEFDKTSYGWGSNCYAYIEGNGVKQDRWTDFEDDECLYFHLTTTQLTMYSDKKNRTFVIDVEDDDIPTYIHINMYGRDTDLSIEPLCDDDFSVFDITT